MGLSLLKRDCPGPVVALIDSGVATHQEASVIEAAAFRMVAGRLETRAAAADRLGHGSALLDILLGYAPTVRVLNAQIFSESRLAQTEAVAHALRWVARLGAQIANLSFGVAQEGGMLREACAALLQAGTLLVAAVPASGRCVYPALFPEVLRVTGDIRCKVGEVSWLGTERADFGASTCGCHEQRELEQRGGSSYAVAHVSGMLAHLLSCGLAPAEAIRHLRRHARYLGPERRR